MRKLVSLSLVLLFAFGTVIPAIAETMPFRFRALATGVQYTFNMARKAGGSDFENLAYFTVLRSVVMPNGTTATSNLVDGDKIDFRSITTDYEYASRRATATRYGNTVHARYLDGKAIANAFYYLGARTNPESAHTNVRVAGQWTP